MAQTLDSAVVGQLLDATGGDWDRRAHRIWVLAEAVRPSVQRWWAGREPRDAHAQTLFACGVLLRAEAGSQEDREAFSSALDACARAAAALPSDPTPWVIRLALLSLAKRPTAEVVPVWEEIQRRDPWHRQAHLQMLEYLTSDGCDWPGQAVSFVEDASRAAPDRSPTVGLPLVSFIDAHRAALQRGGAHALTAHHMWEGQEVSAFLDAAARRWVRPGFLTHAAAVADLNLLAYALVSARRMNEAGALFQSIGGVVSAEPWWRTGHDPVAAFTEFQRKAGV
ncbi:hypothetical protein [Yinghuangia seranimata]|uniref:hypothetical protein n=1 Tax=Yinghuangia seranimata TaxID=408067 RepID=UPI00248C77FD|nr:hypothetical protein [Yinghuangia seranimata]MDI2131275.1 hypothetical protein [Yinghuangia seranimata]